MENQNPFRVLSEFQKAFDPMADVRKALLPINDLAKTLSMLPTTHPFNEFKRASESLQFIMQRQSIAAGVLDINYINVLRVQHDITRMLEPFRAISATITPMLELQAASLRSLTERMNDVMKLGQFQKAFIINPDFYNNLIEITKDAIVDSNESDTVQEKLAVIQVGLDQIHKEIAFNDSKGLNHAYINYVITFLTILYSIYADIKNDNDSSQFHNQLTKIESDLESANSRIEKLGLKVLREAKCDVSVRLRPTEHSIRLGVVSQGTEVEVIVIKHKWIYVTTDDRDGNLLTGWVMKKYFYSDKKN